MTEFPKNARYRLFYVHFKNHIVDRVSSTNYFYLLNNYSFGMFTRLLSKTFRSYRDS